MNESKTLERRYRRLIAMYPRKFRQRREEEMLSVLMSGAHDGQRWPRPAEIVNLARHATPSRLRNGPPPESFARRHPRSVLTIRVLLGIWLLVLTVAFTLRTPWGLAFLLAEALNVYLFARTLVWKRDGGGGSEPPSTLSQSR
ncbi:MAG TPA: hypothetical protein VMF07_16855 [Solirubrobacteraceae bacterium]|nr:hypothetical protein [Solirubrobacteraceae bacterium]